MAKSKIEYCDYTINPTLGCKHGCIYCYAKRMNDRFKWIKDWTKPHYKHDWYLKLGEIKKSSIIFIGSLTDLFGNWVLTGYIKKVIRMCGYYPQHKFLFLTKNPKRYAEFEFSDNCWLGTTITNNKDDIEKGAYLFNSNNKNLFISYEPLLEYIEPSHYKNVRWIICGGLTPKPVHKKEWLDRIVEQCNHYKIPLFIKPNAKYPIIIKNYPKDLIIDNS